MDEIQRDDRFGLSSERSRGISVSRLTPLFLTDKGGASRGTDRNRSTDLSTEEGNDFKDYAASSQPFQVTN